MPHGSGICKCPKHQTRINLYREDFLALNGPGPYPCGTKLHGCGEPVLFTECIVDHVDENRLNNDPGNWQPMHKKCHDRKSRLVAWGDPEKAKLYRETLQRVNDDPAIRLARSERAKQQWAAGNLGRKKVAR